MKITFLGTGAADWPMEKPVGTTEYRRLSSVIIDDTLLIDPGPQVISALHELGKNIQGVKYIINTHKHEDHFCQATVGELECLGASFAELHPGDVKQMGKYTVKAYQGNHSTCEEIVHFIITDGECAVFYGLDGAWLMYDEVEAIKKHTPDLAIIDATVGNIPGDYRIFEHNNLNMVLEMKKTLEPYIKRVCISHMARTLHTDHVTLSGEMNQYQIITAYDGLEINI